MHSGNVKEVVVMHRDRFARFAFGLLECIFKSQEVKLVVHCKNQEGAESTQRLPMIVWQSQQYLWQLIMENEQRKEEGDVKGKEKKMRKMERSKAKKSVQPTTYTQDPFIS